MDQITTSIHLSHTHHHTRARFIQANVCSDVSESERICVSNRTSYFVTEKFLPIMKHKGENGGIHVKRGDSSELLAHMFQQE